MAATERVRERADESRRSVKQDLAAIDAVIYADLFGSAANREMVGRFHLQGGSMDEAMEAVDQLLAEGVLVERGDALCLTGREELLESFPRRRARAATLERRAERLARWLRHLPYVRGLSLTGSTAAGLAPAGADIDLLVIVDSERLATVWLLLGGFATLTRRAFFCPNYYLCEGALEVQRRTHFVAREVVQTRSLVGRGASFARSNRWAYEWFPGVNLPEEPEEGRPSSTPQRMLEFLLGGRIGKWIERRAHGLAQSRLRRHYQQRRGEVPEDVERQWAAGEALRFHGSTSMVGVMKRYGARCAEVEEKIRAARSRPGVGSHA